MLDENDPESLPQNQSQAMGWWRLQKNNRDVPGLFNAITPLQPSTLDVTLVGSQGSQGEGESRYNNNNKRSDSWLAILGAKQVGSGENVHDERFRQPCPSQWCLSHWLSPGALQAA